MPETIDGEVYATTPVIAASTNAPAGGNRPYPTGASKGKAMWQLIKRAMDELDKFEAGPLRQLFDRVAAVEKGFTDFVNNNGATSVRRYQFNNPANSSAGQAVPLTDSSTDGTGTGIGTLDSNGKLTITQAGRYRVEFISPTQSGTYNIGFWRTRNGNRTQIHNQGGTTSYPIVTIQIFQFNKDDIIDTTAPNGNNNSFAVAIQVLMTRLGA